MKETDFRVHASIVTLLLALSASQTFAQSVTQKAPISPSTATNSSKPNSSKSASSNSYLLYQEQADSNMKLKKYDLALTDINKAVALGGGYPDLLWARAQIFLAMKNYPKALNDLTDFLIKRPHDDNARFTRSTIYVVLNRNDNALADLNAILKTNPRMGYAYALRGAVFMKQQKSAQALADYNAALSCGYQDPTMLKNMSEQYAKDEKFETAVTCLTKLIDMTPNGPAKADLYKKRLELYKKEAPTDSNFDSNSKLVAADLLSIAHLEPNNAQVRCQFADSQWQRQPGLALQALDEAIKLDPNNAKSYALRAKIRLDHGRDKDALADASKAIELDPKDASSYLTRAQSQLDLRSYGEAVNDAASALSMAPDLAEAYFFKGEALQASSQNKDALGAFNQYLQLKSKDASPSSDDLRHIEEAKRRVKFVEGRLEAAARMTEINTTK